MKPFQCASFNRFLPFTVFTLSLIFSNPTFAGTITEINLGDFANVQVLDFETAPLGNISSTDALFTNFGIAQAITNAGLFSDLYNVRPNSSRALWSTDGMPRIVDPGAMFNAVDITYSLFFSSTHTRFGVGAHDEGGAYRFEFFNNFMNVGGITLSANDNPDLRQMYLENDMAFNSVLIRGGGGFAIDNITLEGSIVPPVPEPSAMLLFGTGIAGIVAWRLRIRKKTRT